MPQPNETLASFTWTVRPGVDLCAANTEGIVTVHYHLDAFTDSDAPEQYAVRPWQPGELERRRTLTGLAFTFGSA